MLQGANMGTTLFVVLSTYGLAFWYGALRVRDGDITAGTVNICFFAAVTGSMAIGQVLAGRAVAVAK